MSYFINHLDIATVITGLGGAVWYTSTCLITKITLVLEDLLSKTFSAAALPLGVILIIAAFDNSLLVSLQGFSIHIAVAGLAVLYISIKAFWPK